MLTHKEFIKKIDLEKSKKLFPILSYFSKNKCHLCKHKFNNILRKENGGKFVPLVNMFSGEFLFHLKETHGLMPYDFFEGIQKITNVEVLGLKELLNLT